MEESVRYKTRTEPSEGFMFNGCKFSDVLEDLQKCPAPRGWAEALFPLTDDGQGYAVRLHFKHVINRALLLIYTEMTKDKYCENELLKE